MTIKELRDELSLLIEDGLGDDIIGATYEYEVEEIEGLRPARFHSSSLKRVVDGMEIY